MSLILWAMFLTVSAIYIYSKFDDKVNSTYRIGDLCRLLLAPLLLIIYLKLTSSISCWVVASLSLSTIAYLVLWQRINPPRFTKALIFLSIANICWTIHFALKIDLGSAKTRACLLLIVVFILLGYLLVLICNKHKLFHNKAVIFCGLTGLITSYVAACAFLTVASKSLLIGFCGSLALLLSYALYWWPTKNKLLRSGGALSMVIAYMYLLLGSFT